MGFDAVGAGLLRGGVIDRGGLGLGVKRSEHLAGGRDSVSRARTGSGSDVLEFPLHVKEGHAIEHSEAGPIANSRPLRPASARGGERSPLRGRPVLLASMACGTPARSMPVPFTNCLNFEMDGGFQGLPEPDRPHFSAFSYASCSEAFRDDGLLTSSPTEVHTDEGVGVHTSMLTMNGERHRRYRNLVQPSFVPNQAKWWIERWIATTVNALIDTFEADGRAELNVDFDAAIPMLTITGSFGVDVQRCTRH